MKYLAVISDLIASRQLKDRAAVQLALQATLEACNEQFREHLAAAFTITVGDEFQGLLLPTAPVFQILDLIESRMEAVQFRSGIGAGTITTAIDSERALGADGPAFWHARDAIQRIHDHDDYGAVKTAILGLGDQLDALCNDLLATGDALKAGWTDLQRETFGKLLELGIYAESFEQKAVAAELGITDVALYKRLKSSNMKLYLRSRGTLQAVVQATTSSRDLPEEDL